MQSLAASSVAQHLVLVCSRGGRTVGQVASFRIWLSVRGPCSNFGSGSWAWGCLLHVVRVEYYSLLVSWDWGASLPSKGSNLVTWNWFILDLEIVLTSQWLLLIVGADSTGAACYLLAWCARFGWHFELLMLFYISTCSNFVWSNAYIVRKIGKVLGHWYQRNLGWNFLRWFSFLWLERVSWHWGMSWWLRILPHTTCSCLVDLIRLSLVPRYCWVTWCVVWIKIVCG